MGIRLPDDTQRLSIIGATGSGKTTAACWHLSMRNFNRKPWVVYDFKTDALLNQIEGANHMGPNDAIPKQPGIYIAHPHPNETEEVDDQMRRIWEQGDVGVYIDEGYMVGQNSKWFRALLTQGRSRHIPLIVLSQRPVWMDRFVFSESEYFQVFRLQHKKDLDNVQQFIPVDISKRLPEYHSYYYDVGANQMNVLGPVPDADAILDTFDTRIPRRPKSV